MEILMVINQYAGMIFIGLAALMLVFIVLLIKQNSEIKLLKKRYTTLTRGMEGQDYGQLLEWLSLESQHNSEAVEQLLLDVKDLNRRQKSNLNRVAIMHYNAFDFTYGELSFSMAVLDDVGNGFVFTNIHNRDDARCYCKRILSGESKHPLSEEEKDVLEYAINGDSSYSRTAKPTATAR